MDFSDYLAEEWKPALGCTEPACLAYATAVATSVAGGAPMRVTVSCDPRLYKNCYAVGIPHSGGQSGAAWAVALGACLARADLQLEVFRHVTSDTIRVARRMIEDDLVTVRVDPSRSRLWAECRVHGSLGEARVVVQDDHTRIVLVELDGVAQERPPGADRPSRSGPIRAALAQRRIAELVELGCSLSAADRRELRRGAAMNLAMAELGARISPLVAIDLGDEDGGCRASRLVSAGVYARMSGEDQTVMTLAGSGNKGITCAVPIVVRAEERGVDAQRADEALALGCLLTSAATHHLGTLSAVCGSSNAAGIGLAAGLVWLEGGTREQVSLAVTNMVGNVTGMICDGAKIGCAMKCMTGVDAALRASAFARRDVVIPPTDGIVGADGEASLAHLARIAHSGMQAVEREILAIMEEKQDPGRTPS